MNRNYILGLCKILQNYINICSPGLPTRYASIHDICISDFKDSIDFIVHFKHHTKNGNVMDALTLIFALTVHLNN